jgi:hypothetical protein
MGSHHQLQLTQPFQVESATSIITAKGKRLKIQSYYTAQVA